MERLLIALAIMVAAVAIAEVVRRRRRPDAPTQPRYEVPSQLDRSDFPGDGWLVVVFTSETCSTCADVVQKAEVLRSDAVAVEVATFQHRRDLHERYSIEAVPAVLVADGDGVVHASFLGPVTATVLWAAVAEVREPGSIDRAADCEGNHTP